MANARKKAFRNNRRKRKAQEPKGMHLKVMDRFAKFSSLSDYNVEQVAGDAATTIIKELKDNGFIKNGDKTVKIKRADINYFQLTTKGKNFLKNKKYTIYSSNSPRHDIMHASNVLGNFSEREIDRYKHEKELDSFNDEGTSRVDGLIERDDGSVVLVETITRNYSKDKIEAKQAYANIYGRNCEYKVFYERRRR